MDEILPWNLKERGKKKHKEKPQWGDHERRRNDDMAAFDRIKTER